MTVTMTAAPFFSDYGGSWRLILRRVELSGSPMCLCNAMIYCYLYDLPVIFSH